MRKPFCHNYYLFNGQKQRNNGENRAKQEKIAPITLQNTQKEHTEQKQKPKNMGKPFCHNNCLFNGQKQRNNGENRAKTRKNSSNHAAKHTKRAHRTKTTKIISKNCMENKSTVQNGFKIVNN